MSDYDFILDLSTWSFSRIETYERCPRCYYLTYILKKELQDGAFGQYGSLCHTLLEKYYKNELLSFELADQFKENYTKEVTAYFPPIKNGNLSEKYYEQGIEYFNNFDGMSDEYKIIGVEHKYKFNVDKYDFVGIIDLEVQNKDGKYEIFDHKTKSKQDKTRLMKKTNKDDYIQLIDGRYIPFSLAIQLYIYCIPFKEQYGEYPKYLNFNMVRINDLYKFEFNIDDFNKSVQWVKDTIDNIYQDNIWEKGNDVGDFWCDFTCGCNQHCKYSNKYLGDG